MLINHGIPYACVNDGQISDHVAVAFSSAFYEQIALDNAVPVAHERAVNWVMLNVNERAYKLGGINGLRLLGPGESESALEDSAGPAPAPAPAPAALANGAAASRTTKEVAELIRVDLGMSQTETMKQIADAAVAELGLTVAGSLRARLQAVADELDISTGWSDTTASSGGPPGAAEAQPAGAPSEQSDTSKSKSSAGGCPCADKQTSNCAKWLKPWAHFGMDCPHACNHIEKMVAQHGADRVRGALEEMWTEMQKYQACCEEKGDTPSKCSSAECMVKWVAMLKDKLSSSLVPAGQSSSKFRDCPMSRQIWGDRVPSGEDCAIMKRLVKEMDFDPIAASMAVRETGGRGLHAAVEWLLQHLDSLTALSAALEESRAAAAAAADTAADQETTELTHTAAAAAAAAAETTSGSGSGTIHWTQAQRAAVAVRLETFGFDREIAQTVVDSLPADFSSTPDDMMKRCLKTAFISELMERTQASSSSAGSTAEELLSFMTGGSSPSPREREGSSRRARESSSDSP